MAEVIRADSEFVVLRVRLRREWFDELERRMGSTAKALQALSLGVPVMARTAIRAATPAVRGAGGGRGASDSGASEATGTGLARLHARSPELADVPYPD